ncbi:MAG: 2-oxoacid:acceptor oxidoreductase family protein [Peptococcaceae bacterium]|nr:2-oxoacid:acceptor oxidoreductase family protein [Peptococcaceae bacterium]
MKQEMLFSGIGGQGIMMLGEILCNVAVAAGYKATFAPFYGQEKRGGRTMCHVVIADGMESPIISKAKVMLVMDEKSLADFQHMMAADGTLIVNSSMIALEPACTCGAVKKVPFYELAAELGNSKTANMVALGYLMRYLPFLSLEAVAGEVKEAFKAKPKVVPLNVKALELGYGYEK